MSLTPLFEILFLWMMQDSYLCPLSHRTAMLISSHEYILKLVLDDLGKSDLLV